MAREFQQYTVNMGIINGLSQQVYSIITTKIPGIKFDLALQIFLKAINNLMGPNRLVSTLLVFNAYPRITGYNALSSSITQRAISMQRAMDKVRKCTASGQVNNVLNTFNRSSTVSV